MSISALSRPTQLSPMPSVGLSEKYCGKTTDWIWMQFGVLSGVGRGMDVLDRGPRAPRGMGGFGSFSFPLV